MEFKNWFKKQEPAESERPDFSRSALYSDTSPNFISPAEPAPYSKVRICFRSGQNQIDYVFLVQEGHRHLMFRTASDAQFDYYEVELTLEDRKFSYYFEVQAGNETCFYDYRGAVDQPDAHYEFVIVPGLSAPDWAKGAVMYQIYVDRFCNGDPSNDVLTGEYEYVGRRVRRVEDWNQNPETEDVGNFYGGDLQGVLDHLDDLKELGVEVLYLNPIFVSPSNHKYDIQDYDHVDPHFGRIVRDGGRLLEEGETNNAAAERYITRVTDRENLQASDELFQELVEKAHQKGIRILLDGVFNHCGSFNKWMDRERIYENAPGYEKGAYISADSPYHDYFEFRDPKQFPYNPTYDGWWGYETLPKLNYEGSKQLEEYILSIAKKWVSPPFCADGWRLDVAADLGHSREYNLGFWTRFREAVRQANPDALVLAEHYGDCLPWLQGGQWDSVMNYDAFMEPVTWFLTGMEKHSDDFRSDLLGNAESFFQAMAYHGAGMPMSSMLTCMNELSNHDHSRFLTRTNHKVGRIDSLGADAAQSDVNRAVMREAVVIQMTWIGAPTVYYGDEAGLCGFTDPDNRRSYPWGREDSSLLEFHKAAIRMHKENPEFKTGSLKWLGGADGFIAYGRFTRTRHSVILINHNDRDYDVDLSVWELGIPQEARLKRILYSDADGFDTKETFYLTTEGRLFLTMPKTCAMVLQYENAEEKLPRRRKFKINFWQRS